MTNDRDAIPVGQLVVDVWLGPDRHHHVEMPSGDRVDRFEAVCAAVQKILDVERPQIGAVREVPYAGPITVGDYFIWEPSKPNAWAHVQVTGIDTVDSQGTPFDERRIWTVTLSRSPRAGGGDLAWNEEGRFREAVVKSDAVGRNLGR